MSFVAKLEPRELWEHFDRILKIPRGSGNEEAIRDYVIRVGQQTSLDYTRDEVGNLVLRKPAAAGCEKAVGGAGLIIRS